MMEKTVFTTMSKNPYEEVELIKAKGRKQDNNQKSEQKVENIGVFQ